MCYTQTKRGILNNILAVVCVYVRYTYYYVATKGTFRMRFAHDYCVARLRDRASHNIIFGYISGQPSTTPSLCRVLCAARLQGQSDSI